MSTTPRKIERVSSAGTNAQRVHSQPKSPVTRLNNHQQIPDFVRRHPPRDFRPRRPRNPLKRRHQAIVRAAVRRARADLTHSNIFYLTPKVLLLLIVALLLLSTLPKGFHLFQEHRLMPRLVIESQAPVMGAPKLSLPELRLSTQSRVVHRVQKGDNWNTIFTRYGIASEEAAAVQTAIAVLEKSSNQEIKLRAKRIVELDLSPRLRSQVGLREIIYPVDGTHQLEISPVRSAASKTSAGAQPSYRAELNELERERVDRVAVGVITSSFAAAAQKAGVPYRVIDDLVDLFSDRVSFNEDFRVGDRFTVIYRDSVNGPGDDLSVGPILAAVLDVNGERLVAARYVGSDGKPRYFDGSGKLLGNSFLRYPLQFSRISSYFSFARFHPILGISRPHNGVDFAAPIGTPVRTVANGKVMVAGRNGGSGIMVRIQHGDRFTTEYLHLSKIDPSVRQGGTVERGQVIGAVGETGLATGPHLHFGFFDNGKYVDPLSMKLPFLDSLVAGAQMEPGYLKRVNFTLEHYQSMDLNTFLQ